VTQGGVYTTFVKSELDAEEARRSEINARSLAALSTSGGQFAIVVGLAAFVERKDFHPSRVGAVLFVLALVEYLLAVALALVATSSHKTAAASPPMLMAMLSDRWMDHEVDASNFVARAQVRSIATLRAGNDIKVKWLKASLVVQVAAVCFLGAAAIVLAA
jgi:hypothetical protein